MNENQYSILKFLSGQKNLIKKDSFPDEIKSAYKAGIGNGSLQYELSIILKNKGWVLANRDQFQITENGFKSLQAEDLKRNETIYINQLQFHKLELEVIDLKNKVNSFKTIERRAKITIWQYYYR